MEPKKLKFSLNGKACEVAPNTSIFQAATEAGIFIPHYCYHPDLSVAGVCRMCVVEVEKNPRLQISCNTPVTDGMVVRTDTDKVKQGVKSCLELHLINHPLDCPICDKAGECKLQDFYSEYGLYESRMDFEKVHKPKVIDIGTIVLDSERCILCTRCVRFTSEVTHTHELGIFNRGDRSELKTYDDGPLRNDYTGNLADICPVGALTAKDFRFQCRVWFLEKTPSVCGQCAHGCNTTISVNPDTRKLYRVEPRRNPEVNKSWICDTGRWDYHYVYKENRISVPKSKVNGVWRDVTWHETFMDWNSLLTNKADRVLFGLSAHMTMEEITDAVQTLSNLGAKHFTWLVDEKVVNERKPFDGILKHHDLTPNAAGLEFIFNNLKVPLLKQAEAIQRLKKNDFDSVLLMGLEGEIPQGWDTLIPSIGIPLTIHATNFVPLFETATRLLPNVSAFEKSGTYMNAQNRMQKLNAVIPRQYTSRDIHSLVQGITAGNDREKVSPSKPKHIFESVLKPLGAVRYE